jgi:hypothetical protein
MRPIFTRFIDGIANYKLIKNYKYLGAIREDLYVSIRDGPL